VTRKDEWRARLDHVGIAVDALERRLPFWAEALGLEVGGISTVASEDVKVAFLPAGQARIELLEPTSESGPVGRHLAKRGEGVHHLTFAVPDLELALERMRERGAEVIGGGPRAGAAGTRVAFLHPRATGGVLVELVERAAAPSAPPSAPPGETHDIVPGQCVLLYLREPQEKLWGVLRRLDGAGVVIEGIDLGSFDDWVGQIEREEEAIVGPSVLFVPMTRLERILLDCSSGPLPSLAERFQRRVGRSVQDVLADE
jgi:methylmalonyl-CoA/ethylmalonyl-CoA epimerase